jgi:hypothetical protein
MDVSTVTEYRSGAAYCDITSGVATFFLAFGAGNHSGRL